MSKVKKILIIIYVFVLVILVGVIYVIPSVTGMMTPTEILQYGNLQVTDEATCYLIRDEIVYLAGATGTINYYVSQDTHLRAGAKVLEIINGGVATEESKYSGILAGLASSAVQSADYIAPNNGIVSYYIDGYESYFTLENAEHIKYDDISDIQIQIENLTRKNTLVGEPIYKICDNNTWHIMCWVDLGDVSKYQMGKEVKIQFPMGEFSAKVCGLFDEQERWKAIFETDRFYQDFSKIRKVDAKIIVEDYSGILVPNKSITAEEGQPGVYVKSRNGEFIFMPIKVYISDGEYSIAEEREFYDSDGNGVKTVKIYDEILKNPDRK